MKQVIIGVVLVVGILVGASMLSGNDDVAGAPSNNTYGTNEPVLTVTEYGDFECPACASFFPIVTQIKETFQDQVKFEFKHFPLVQIHPNATAAHRAAQAAANQGMFWEMHDLLFARQASWRATGAVGHNGTPISTNNPGAIFEGYAEELGLDMDQYRTDVALSSTLGTINADVAAGKEQGAESTPTFYINGERVEELTSISTVAAFTDTLNEALEANGGTPIEDTTSASDNGINVNTTIEPTTLPDEN